VGPGQTFSQQLVTASEDYITRRLGNEGYNFATVTGIPEIDESDNSVALKFFVDPGKRTYVRRIRLQGQYADRRRRAAAGDAPDGERAGICRGHRAGADPPAAPGLFFPRGGRDPEVPATMT
jgi:hypothetical protein